MRNHGARYVSSHKLSQFGDRFAILATADGYYVGRENALHSVYWRGADPKSCGVSLHALAEDAENQLVREHIYSSEVQP